MEQKYSIVLRGTCRHEFQVPASPGSTRRHSNSVMLRVRENYVPVASERVALLSSVADIEREILNDVLPEITRLEDVMAVVTASLDRQNKRKEALEHQIAAQKSLLFSPSVFFRQKYSPLYSVTRAARLRANRRTCRRCVAAWIGMHCIYRGHASSGVISACRCRPCGPPSLSILTQSIAQTVLLFRSILLAQPRNIFT